MKDSNAKPLTEGELDRLEELLASFDNAMTLERVDGFFAALICGPELVQLEEWLLAVLGENYARANDDDARNTVLLLIRHWNTIADTLEFTLSEETVYLPVLSLDEEDGVAHANEWADGFMDGINMRRESWQELFSDENHAGSLVPVLMLYHEDDPDPELRTDPKALENREEIIQVMIASLTHIYRYFDERRQENARRDAAESMPRKSDKVGRNEPCPCGSGRKYKHCCGAGSSTLH
ncbi:yecA family protein [Caballeronia catudaia]|uniref:YecA family protein n=1 Tax=Caballeronia catudaia TaxID=1777136 RepID=A0A157ZNK7_9BURK|nr:UPF0149 family protein [Caballeronia catudaia]SAK47071.1 yecA family protein [Caballeronia catudaia]